MKRDQQIEQAKPICELIEYARERDALGKANPDRGHLIEALMVLGRTRKEAERAIENARRRVRKAADKAEHLLEHYLRHEDLWNWTDPRQAIRDMRGRAFGCYEDAPLTDIEEALVQKGNVLWIIAVYPALKMLIFKRLGEMRAAAHAETPQSAPPAPNEPESLPEDTSPMSP